MKKHAMALGYFFLSVLCLFVRTKGTADFEFLLVVAALGAAAIGLGFLFFACAEQIEGVRKWLLRIIPPAADAARRSSTASDDRLVEVYRAENSPHAHTLKWALEDEGIQALIDGDQFAGALGDVTGWSSAPKIMVRERDLPRARALLERWEAAETPETSEA